MSSVHIHIHIDSPYLSKETFSERSGIPLRTVEDKALSGELPADKLNLTETRNGATYINMVKLYEMAASSPFKHPRFPTINTKA